MAAQRSTDMKEYTKQLEKLTTAVNAFGERFATIEQWKTTTDKDVSDLNKLVYGNGGDGLKLKVDRLDGRVTIVFAVGAGAWALFMIVFSLVAANLVEKMARVLP